MNNGYNQNLIPGSPDSLWGWTTNPQLREWQNRTSVGMAGAGIGVTATEALQLVTNGRGVPMVFIDLLRRMNGS